MITQVNPTPKERFLNLKEAVHAHRELMQRPDLQFSLDFAMLEYLRQVQSRTQEQFAGAGHLRMAGALEFVDTLKRLGESPVGTPKLVETDNLQHKR